MRLQDCLMAIDMAVPERPDIFKLFPEDEIVVKAAYFSLALRGLVLDPVQIQAVRRVLVNNESRIAVSRDTGVSVEQLTLVANNVLANLKVQMDLHSLVLEDVIICRDMLPMFEIIERETIRYVME